MKFLIPLLTVLTIAAWASAAVHGVWSLTHLSGRTSLGWMLFRRIEWFNPENFTDRGQVLRRRFVASFAAFLGSLLVTALVTMLAR